VTRPVEELRGFRRVGLQPGETCTVAFRLASEQLGLVDPAFRCVVEPGRFQVWVGTSSEDLPLTAELELVGAIVEITDRRCYLTSTHVETRGS
jgi:beta-glucosidase